MTLDQICGEVKICLRYIIFDLININLNSHHQASTKMIFHGRIQTVVGGYRRSSGTRRVLNSYSLGTQYPKPFFRRVSAGYPNSRIASVGYPFGTRWMSVCYVGRKQFHRKGSQEWQFSQGWKPCEQITNLVLEEEMVRKEATLPSNLYQVQFTVISGVSFSPLVLIECFLISE